MAAKNKLSKILLEMGMRHIVPSSDLLQHQLGGMTLHRFNKLLSNTSKKELTASEVGLLTTWLSTITNKPKSEISLLEEEEVAS